MLYTFKSKAAGNLIMLGPNGDELLQIIGRPRSAMGVITPEDMPAALQAIEAAIARADAAVRKADRTPAPDAADNDREPAADPVTLRQRAWPFVEMLQRAHQAGEVITWGV
jgi:hypothetical protein